MKNSIIATFTKTPFHFKFVKSLFMLHRIYSIGIFTYVCVSTFHFLLIRFVFLKKKQHKPKSEVSLKIIERKRKLFDKP